MTGLRKRFAKKYGDSAVSGLYQGYMDMTYFALLPPSLKSRDLKVAVVFNYGAFGFEAWLSAHHRKVQRQYWELFKDSGWAEYRIVAPAAGIDSIIECDLAKDFDFSDPDALTLRIENAIAVFIDTIDKFLLLSIKSGKRQSRAAGQCYDKKALRRHSMSRFYHD